MLRPRARWCDAPVCKHALVLDQRVNLRTLIWMYPFVSLIHDTEELATMESFWRENRQRLPLPDALKNRLETTTAQFAVSVAYQFALGAIASAVAWHRDRRGTGSEFFNLALSIRFINVWTHLAQSLALRRYTPGVVTAVTAMLPYSLYVYRRLFGAKRMDQRSLSRSLLAGMVATIPVIASALALGRLRTRSK